VKLIIHLLKFRSDRYAEKNNMNNIFKLLMLYIGISCIGIFHIFAQENSFIKIWPGQPLYSLTAENFQRAETDSNNVTRYYDITIPELEYFKPEIPNGVSVIICPGGGYTRLAYSFEGGGIGKWFSDRGISAFVLKYRLPNDKFMTHKERVPLADLQQAIYYLKNNAADYNINPDKIGVLGSSAGGHLAASASTHFESAFFPINNGISLRPYFSILIYPVITMKEEFTHKGSRKNLLGDNPDKNLINFYSNEMNVTANTPMTFLLHASDDASVPVSNSLIYYQELVKNNVPAAMHIFQNAGHGFAMRNKWVSEQWLYLLDKWLIENKIL